MKKYIKIIILIIIILTIGIIGYNAVKNRGGTVVVREAPFKQEVVTKTVSASGRVTSKNEASLSFSAAGTILSISVSEGEEVPKGKTLARLDSSSISHSTQALKDARDIAIRNKELFIEQFENNKSLAGGEREYEIKLRTLNEQISQAEANYKASLAGLNNLFINAPFNGTIIDINMNPGETVSPATPVMKIADLNNLVFEVTVDQEDIGLLKNGQNVEVVLDAYPNNIFSAVIQNIPLFADTTNSFSVEMKLINGEGHPVLLGMEGDANIIVESTDTPVKTLDYDQVYSDDSGNTYVWVVNETGLLIKRNIEKGLEGDLYVEIKSEINGNERVVAPLNDNQELEEGVKVQVIE